LSGDVLKINTDTGLYFDGFEDVYGNDYSISNGIIVGKFDTGRVYATQSWVQQQGYASGSFVTTTQGIKLQVYDGQLEYYYNGTWTKLANL